MVFFILTDMTLTSDNSRTDLTTVSGLSVMRTSLMTVPTPHAQSEINLNFGQKIHFFCNLTGLFS